MAETPPPTQLQSPGAFGAYETAGSVEFAATSDGVYLTPDKGLTWKPSSGGIGSNGRRNRDHGPSPRSFTSSAARK